MIGFPFKQTLAAASICCLLWTMAAHAAEEPAPQLAYPMQNDAELADVFFIDPQLGWAVGDRGVIWHTGDGGQSWSLQKSNVACRLNSVWFLDEKTGWAGGGATEPYTHSSIGCLLQTRDGGQTWSPTAQLLVPALRRIKFFDPQRGVALAHPSALYPSGVLTTDDGGRSFGAVPSKMIHAWQAGDFLDRQTGAVAGHSTQLATVRRRLLSPARTSALSLRSFRRMILTSPAGGWLVGDGGLVLKTNDLGQTWQVTDGALLPSLSELFDLEALAVHGSHVWVAGSPGTRVFHSGDGGRTFNAYATNHHVPIRAMTFADASHGWAVGALGTVLATRDGGETWKVQRAGGARAALLGFYSTPRSVPLELFAKHSAAEGYLAHVDIIGRQGGHGQAGPGAGAPDLAHEALVRTGACGTDTAWRFPLPPDALGLSQQQLLADLDMHNDGRTMQKLTTHLVRQIRTWRPEVIVTHPDVAQQTGPLAHIVHNAVLRAVNAAADATQHVELAVEAGLPPWQVKRVFAAAAGEVLGGLTAQPQTNEGDSHGGESRQRRTALGPALRITTDQFQPQLEQSLADFTLQPRGLIHRAYHPAPATIQLQKLFRASDAHSNAPGVDRADSAARRRGLFHGITLAPGSDARRPVMPVTRHGIERLQQMAQKSRNTQRLLDQQHADPAWLGQVSDLTRGLPASSAGEILFRLGQQYHTRGNWDLAAETLERLTVEYPDHPLSGYALVWLLKYYSSGEAQVHSPRSTTTAVTQTSANLPHQPQLQPATQTSPPVSPLGKARPELVERGGLGGVRTHPTQAETQLERAANVARRLDTRHPMLAAEPDVVFPRAVAYRKLGYGQQAEKLLLGLRRTRPQDAWWECAEAERWLADPGGDVPPMKICSSARAAAKPHLDGRFDDPIWQSARPLELGAVSPRTEAMFAYDADFLYIAVRCAKPAGRTYFRSDGPRPRDPDLADRDRVELLIDVDRDYATSYRLTMDHRGWVGETCWDDATWNPTWYVAAEENEDEWTLEAAIAHKQLAAVSPATRHVWALGIQRIIPGTALQSWPAPSSPQSHTPARFGLLIFE